MKIDKHTKYFLITGAVVLLVAGGLGATAVLAETTENPHNLLISNIAAKFNLNEDEVAKVFEETRQQQETLRLDRAVENGKITEAQKSLILTKQKEFEVKRDEIRNKGLAVDDEREAMRTLREEIKAWADENNIPAGLVMGGGKGGRGGMGPGGERPEMPADASINTDVSVKTE